MLKHNIVLLWFICFSLATKQRSVVIIPEQGAVEGVEIANMRIHKILGFYGIPYALPPLDNLRFSLPVTDPLPRWEGIRNISGYLTSCLQASEGYTNEDLLFFDLFKESKFNTSEDCLYLNIFTPIGGKPPNGFDVIVWIHPGNFVIGSPSIWNPHTLVHRQNVIVVTFAYRLNIMGFFTTMDGEASGNYGLFDQQAALKWIKNNILLFRGNPDNIVLMGSGAGGISVGIHMINTESRKLFHKAIIMSANFLDSDAVRQSKEDRIILDNLAEKFACSRNPTSQLIDCLRSADGEYLVQSASHFKWRPLIDKDLSNNTPAFLLDLPRKYFEAGEFSYIPLLTGYTHMEKVLSVDQILDDRLKQDVSENYANQIIRDIIEKALSKDNKEYLCGNAEKQKAEAIYFFYHPWDVISNIEMLRKVVVDLTTDISYGASTVKQASFVASKNKNTYVYRFDLKPSSQYITVKVPDWVTVPHLFDLIYIWGIPYWKHESEFDIRDKRISDAMMSFWTSFAKYSEPTKSSVYAIHWEKFSSQSQKILLIDNTFTISNTTNVNHKAFEFWNEYLPKMSNFSDQCCSHSTIFSDFLYTRLFVLLHLNLTIYFSA